MRRPATRAKLIGSQIFCDSHLPWAHIATASAVTAVHGAIWSPRINTWKESAKSIHPDSKMAGEPGEAMAHSAFDTILVLDFG